VKQKHHAADCALPQCPCPNEDLCPLAQVKVGAAVKIRQLQTIPEIAERLREMGVYEQQKLRLLLKGNNLICQVCNARLGISSKLAEKIMVEPLHPAAETHG
jgi:Fe2+ transport system protein FeoA